MKAVALLLLAMAAIVGLIAGAIFGLGDREILTSPPEAVVEGFSRQLAAGRFDRALPYLDEPLAARTGAETLRRETDRLRARVGRIDDVRGEAGAVRGDRAEATALLRTERAGEIPLRFSLPFRQGSWSITDFSSLSH